ncbi:hypothetical protein [Comamonas sp.]|uniref:hypothetical protein n=1 Tax=Comamonas sp. TaxID=34028 RepID=UPI003A94CAFD
MRTLEEIKGRCFIDVDGHWLWRGAVRPNGSPNIYAPDYRFEGRMTAQCGYRAVWNCQHKKPIPAGYRVFLTCDEPACCNPEHIRCASDVEFGKWLQRKGIHKGQTKRIQANRAIGRKRAKLTPEMVSHIQSSDKSLASVAAELGISTCTAWRARQGMSVVSPVANGVFSGLLALA